MSKSKSLIVFIFLALSFSAFSQEEDDKPLVNLKAGYNKVRATVVKDGKNAQKLVIYEGTTSEIHITLFRTPNKKRVFGPSRLNACIKVYEDCGFQCNADLITKRPLKISESLTEDAIKSVESCD